MNILFDLDGTICNTEEGVVNSALFALEQMGKPQPERKKMRAFIGPPIKNSFMNICGLTQEEAVEGIKLFRQHYSVIGKFENEMYQGMRELFSELVRSGHKIFVATSKMEKYAVEILEKHGVDKLFTAIRGATPDGSVSEKADIVENILNALPKNEKAMLIGDTSFDMEGARANNIPCTTVGFGFGNIKELKKADKYCETVAQLREYLISLPN